ncbi:spermidine synthase [Phenylobacterium sp.]|uniref:spermine/spermidine synthase domain-containing protein n=1 Tax=Phenylobacterium sp. TaxID=1871053 RepID=UPI002628EA23|nr:spermidine synthase [Phenylobacterium sp.]
MKPWIHLDTAQMPDGGGDLRLMRRDTEFSIMAGSIELMNSRLSGSEEALATLAWARLAGRPAPRILIGGLGMGFTLRAALAVLPADAQITVAELVPAVVAWARGPLAEVFKGGLDDPRVTIHEGDVGPLIAAAPAAWDAILLDVDNGPEGLTRKANDSLYDLPGLARAQTALRPGGVLAVWSSAPDEGFTRRMRRSGLATEVVRVPARKGGRGARHVIWLGVRG